MRSRSPLLHGRWTPPSLSRCAALAVCFSSVVAAATPVLATGETAGVVQQRIAPAGQATEIGSFGTSPESPDGRKIAYVTFDWKAEDKSEGYSKGALYLCDADLTHHVKVRDISRARWHNGAMQIWLDNDTLAYMDYLPGKGYVTYVIRKNGDLVLGPLDGGVGHGDTPHASVLLVVDKKQYPNGSNLGSNGLYLYQEGKVRQVVDLEKDIGPLRGQLDGSDSTDDWVVYHPQLSPQGTYISIRLDTNKGVENLVTCKADGTDARLFVAAVKPLHQQWYDDSTLFGHERGGQSADGSPRLQAKRWDRNGKYIETLAGPGNHLGMSPDRKYLASETMYYIDPVVLRLYRAGNPAPLAVLMNEPEGNVWKRSTHVNPAFSRDGRKLYFNKPVDGMPQVHRIEIDALVRAPN